VVFHNFPLFLFQSTRPRGARHNDAQNITGRVVSIHAPARGATGEKSTIGMAKSFNPRARAGRDQTLKIPLVSALFQSTRPRGARRCLNHFDRLSLRFNPRARAGRDYIKQKLRLVGQFQSTRPRGARPYQSL